MTWTLPDNVGVIPEKARVCWNCRHCFKWTQTPDAWVGRCLKEGAADELAWIWLERDTCGYFDRHARAEEGGE